jgi:hypothetical protein
LRSPADDGLTGHRTGRAVQGGHGEAPVAGEVAVTAQEGQLRRAADPPADDGLRVHDEQHGGRGRSDAQYSPDETVGVVDSHVGPDAVAAAGGDRDRAGEGLGRSDRHYARLDGIEPAVTGHLVQRVVLGQPGAGGLGGGQPGTQLGVVGRQPLVVVAQTVDGGEEVAGVAHRPRRC